MAPEWHRDLALLAGAAEAAGAIALGHFRRDVETWEKPGEADVARQPGVHQRGPWDQVRSHVVDP